MKFKRDFYFKKGLTLVEMLVSIVIFMLIMGGFVMLFNKSFKANSFVIEEGETTRIATAAIDILAGDLRKVRQADNGDYAIKSGNDFDLVVYLDDDSDGITERVHYYLDGDNLTKGITKPNTALPPVYPNEDQTIKTIANYVMNTSSQPIFYYYNKDYPGDIVNNPLNISPVLEVDQVKLVRVYLWINIKPLTAPDNVVFETFIDLRNLNENI